MNNQNMIETVTRISGVNPRKCMRCGKCSASCPAYDEMEYHPHQFVSMVENGRIEELLSTKGIYTCLSCFASSNVRPFRSGTSIPSAWVSDVSVFAWLEEPPN